MYAILLYNTSSNFWNISEMLTERIQTITSYRYIAVTYYKNWEDARNSRAFDFELANLLNDGRLHDIAIIASHSKTLEIFNNIEWWRRLNRWLGWWWTYGTTEISIGFDDDQRENV